MKTFRLLYMDWGISKSKTETAFCECFNSTLIDFSKEFRKKLDEKDQLMEEIKPFVDRGEVIPLELIDKFIIGHMQYVLCDRVILTGYPRTAEQYLRLNKVLKSLSASIDGIWYVKQRDPDLFFSQYFADKRVIISAQKYGEEFPSKWKHEFHRRRREIEDVMGVTSDTRWHVVEMDYQPNVSEKDFMQKIHLCA